MPRQEEVLLEFSEEEEHDWLLSFYKLQHTFEEEADGIHFE